MDRAKGMIVIELFYKFLVYFFIIQMDLLSNSCQYNMRKMGLPREYENV